MASAQKRPKRDENETIDGYIHMISPVKTSKNKNIKYFKFEIYGRCLFQAGTTLQLPRLEKEKVSS